MLSRREVLGLLPIVAGAIALPTHWQPITIDDNTSHDDLALEFVHLTGMSGWLQSVHRDAFSNLAKNLPEQFARLDAKFTSEQFWEEQQTKNADILNAHYEKSFDAVVAETKNVLSRSELLKLIEFFKSPIAKKLIDATSKMAGLNDVPASLQQTILRSVEPEFAIYYKA